MKHFIKLTVSSVTILLLMCGAALAQEFNAKASVIVPNIMYSYADSISWTQPGFNITNITGTTIKCKITIFDHDGLDITSRGAVQKGGRPNMVNISTGTGEFELPAHSTRMFHLQPSGEPINTTGHAVIEWTSDDPNLRKALIGGLFLLRSDGGGGMSSGNLFINNGQPF